ncbi:hypothetical protein B0J12DRAFT_737463 [Macrophomina phaseolina]|uniref:SNF2-related protein n=1 Tax=Macrophomina phaseolina TaxID=35725 RepID=A0ABQ8GL25_9PEZI|nr:hypothetical protein B0J12DRAFT_737463 [Macrophomina phaseolina]
MIPDLTAASRVYLLEPQWNPATEDKALARAHRMDQKHPLATVRLVVRGSFEEHVMSVQDWNRQLAVLLFSEA